MKTLASLAQSLRSVFNRPVARLKMPLNQRVLDEDPVGVAKLLATKAIDPEDLRHALVSASQIGSSETLQLLLQHGAEPNSSTMFGLTPLQVAYDPVKMRMLLNAGGDPNLSLGPLTVLQHHCRSGDQHAPAALLIERGADVHAAPNGEPPLHIASAQWKASKLVAILLQTGADPNQKDEQGRTAVEIAIENACTENVRLLVAAGASLPPHVEDESFWEALTERVKENFRSAIPDIRRIARSALLARDINSAMGGEEPQTSADLRPSTGPTPL